MPAGVQFVGPYLGDRTTLKFAQLLEQQSAASWRRVRRRRLFN
jgi:Asp-tRNA(Asn)/Glu-tRNA(Gln) amidotransferase A subunit family amidase